MSKIFQVTTIRTEDFPAEERKWIPRLLTPLNLFITNVTQLLNGRVTFVSNIPAQDMFFSFNEGGSPQRIKWSLVLAPRLVWIGQAFENNVLIPVCSTWNNDASTGTLEITFLKQNGTPLTVGAQYRIFVRIVP